MACKVCAIFSSAAPAVSVRVGGWPPGSSGAAGVGAPGCVVAGGWAPRPPRPCAYTGASETTRTTGSIAARLMTSLLLETTFINCSLQYFSLQQQVLR